MTESHATEILFYHLERTPLERVLPELLERTLERGWRAVVQGGSQERLDALDASLWTYREDSFLPHGTAADGNPDEHPVYLTTGSEAPNGADVKFCVDGAESPELEGYERIVFLFDGHDDTAVEKARAQWASVRDAGHQATYWQQDEQGKWQKKA